jgi:hypothetical protein
VRIWLICAQACCAAPEWRSRDRSASTAAGILCSGSRPKPTSRPYCGLGPRCSGDSREMLMPWAAAALARVTSSVSAASARSSCIPARRRGSAARAASLPARARRGRGGAGRRSGSGDVPLVLTGCQEPTRGSWSRAGDPESAADLRATSGSTSSAGGADPAHPPAPLTRCGRLCRHRHETTNVWRGRTDAAQQSHCGSVLRRP